MIIDLVGIYEDGSKRGRRVPESARRSVTIVQGATVLLRLSVINPAGSAVDVLAGGWSLVWSAKKVRNGCSFKRLGSPSVIDGVGHVNFVLTAEETSKLKKGKYAYDIFMLGPGGIQEPVVPYSELIVEPSKYVEDTVPITPSPTLPIVIPSADAVYLPGFDTSGLDAGRMVYASSNYGLDYTDASDLPYANALGHYDGASGKILAFGIAKYAAFVSTSPTPTPNQLVFLARGDEEADAAGKLSISPPTSGFVSPVGSIVSVGGDFASTRIAEVLVRVQSFVKRASVFV